MITGGFKYEVRGRLGACWTWGVESENRRFRQNRPQRDQFLSDLQPNSRAIGQKDGKKWAAAVDLQPTIRKSDRLLGERRRHSCSYGNDEQRRMAEKDTISCIGFGETDY